MRIMYDTKSNKTGVELFATRENMENERGVVCFFNITNTPNDFQSTDCNMIECGKLKNNDPFIINRLEKMKENDPLCKSTQEYLGELIPRLKKSRG